jgi:hypothetical protein
MRLRQSGDSRVNVGLVVCGQLGRDEMMGSCTILRTWLCIDV